MTPTSLDYADRPQVLPPRRIFSWLVFITSGMMLGFLAFELCFSVQPMKALFNDFHLKLPAPTQLLLDLSDCFASGGWIGFVVLPILLGFLIPRLHKRETVRTPEDYAQILNRLIAAMIIGLSILAIIIVLHVAMVLPITSLIEGISGGNRR